MQQARADAQSVLLTPATPTPSSTGNWDAVLSGVGNRRHTAALFALLGASLVLLLIASANAVNLEIGRTASRMPEMSVRSALGAALAG